jgi:RNA polymerase primary sigma factor
MRQLKISKSITNREIASLDTYLGDIAREELLTPDDEVQLAQKIKQNDQAALDKLVKANLRFVVSVAKQYQHQGLSLPDLINEGNIGLIKAASVLMKHAGLSLSLTLSGGSGSLFSRQLLNSQDWSDYH